MEEGVIAPRVYVISRSAGPGLVQTALAAFSITPLSCVIIFTSKDYPLAREFGTLILRTDDEMTAVNFAMESFEESKMPSLVIGARDGIKAIYEEGRIEDLNWTANLTVN